MKHEPSVPPQSPRSQSEISRASSGHEWNNGISRRSFLKRTGGATVGTLVAWYSSSMDASANLPPVQRYVNCKLVITLQRGDGRVWLDDVPSGGIESDPKPFNSGDTLTPWEFLLPRPPGAMFDPATQRWYIDAPVGNMPDISLTYRRIVIPGDPKIFPPR